MLIWTVILILDGSEWFCNKFLTKKYLILSANILSKSRLLCKGVILKRLLANVFLYFYQLYASVFFPFDNSHLTPSNNFLAQYKKL